MPSFCQEKRPLSNLCALVFIFSMWTPVSLGDFEPVTLRGKEGILIAAFGEFPCGVQWGVGSGLAAPTTQQKRAVLTIDGRPQRGMDRSQLFTPTLIFHMEPFSHSKETHFPGTLPAQVIPTHSFSEAEILARLRNDPACAPFRKNLPSVAHTGRDSWPSRAGAAERWLSPPRRGGTRVREPGSR